jgi:hypothetical protein
VTPDGPQQTEVIVIDTFTVMVSRNRDGAFISEVIDLPGCGAKAASMDELSQKTRGAISSFLSGK